jgi:hypothetical protein
MKVLSTVLAVIGLLLIQNTESYAALKRVCNPDGHGGWSQTCEFSLPPGASDHGHECARIYSRTAARKMHAVSDRCAGCMWRRIELPVMTNVFFGEMEY